MAFDFDPTSNDVDTMDGFDDGTEQPEEATVGEENLPVPGTPAGYIPDAVVERLLVPEPQEEDYEKVLSQVDRRMRVAHFYRDVLEADLFSEKTPEAKIVQGRIRKFCNDELEVIFGMRSAQTASMSTSGQFSADEVKVLKELVTRLTLAETAKQAKAPVKPVNKVQQVQPKAPAVVQIRTQAPQSRPIPPAPPLQVHAPPQQQVINKPSSGGDLRIPEQYRNDPTAKVVKGKVYVQARDDDQNLLWRSVDSTTGRKLRDPVPIMRDVTPVAKPAGALIQPVPMPSMLGDLGSPFSQVMQQHADSTLAMIDRASAQRGVGGRIAQQFGGALAISLLNKAGDEDEYEH